MTVKRPISIFAGSVITAGTAHAVEVRSQFNAASFKHLKHAGVWIPQLANRTDLEMEQE